MKDVTATPKELKKFGKTFAIICLLVAAFLLYKGNPAWVWLVCGAMFFLLTGFFVHSVLKPIYIGWMSFAVALGWLNTRILLGAMFYLVFTPAAMFLRLLRKDIMHLRFQKQSSTYWVRRERAESTRENYERLF